MRQNRSLGTRNVIGHNITRIRQAQKISQAELLLRLQLQCVDLSQTKLSRIEGQRVVVTDRDFIALAEALNVTLDELTRTDS